jgi:hypothetical protein
MTFAHSSVAAARSGAGLAPVWRAALRMSGAAGRRPESACVWRSLRYVSRTSVPGAPAAAPPARWLGCCTCSGTGPGGSMPASRTFSASTLPPRRGEAPLVGCISPVDFARQQLKRKMPAAGRRARGKRAEVTEPVMGEVATIQSAPRRPRAVAAQPGRISALRCVSRSRRASGWVRGQSSRASSPLPMRSFQQSFGASVESRLAPVPGWSIGSPSRSCLPLGWLALAASVRRRVAPLGVQQFGASSGAPAQRSNRNRISF